MNETIKIPSKSPKSPQISHTNPMANPLECTFKQRFTYDENTSEIEITLSSNGECDPQTLLLDTINEVIMAIEEDLNKELIPIINHWVVIIVYLLHLYIIDN